MFGIAFKHRRTNPSDSGPLKMKTKRERERKTVHTHTQFHIRKNESTVLSQCIVLFETPWFSGLTVNGKIVRNIMGERRQKSHCWNNKNCNYSETWEKGSSNGGGTAAAAAAVRKQETHTSTEPTHARTPNFSLFLETYIQTIHRDKYAQHHLQSSLSHISFPFNGYVWILPKKNRTKCFCCCCCYCCQLKTYNCSDKHTRRQIHLECQPNIGNASLAQSNVFFFFLSRSFFSCSFSFVFTQSKWQKTFSFSLNFLFRIWYLLTFSLCLEIRIWIGNIVAVDLIGFSSILH